MTSLKFFEKKTFMGQKYRRMEDYKPLPGLPRNQDFVKRGGLEPKLKSFSNMSNLGDKVNKWVRLECILLTLPVPSRDQAKFGETLLFSFILGLGG